MGAPVGIALIAGIAIPAMIIGIPVYVGRKVRLYTHQSAEADKNESVYKHYCYGFQCSDKLLIICLDFRLKTYA